MTTLVGEHTYYLIRHFAFKVNGDNKQVMIKKFGGLCTSLLKGGGSFHL